MLKIKGKSPKRRVKKGVKNIIKTNTVDGQGVCLSNRCEWLLNTPVLRKIEIVSIVQERINKEENFLVIILTKDIYHT